MAVGVERQADLRVAERFHNGARIDPLREQECRGGVAQVVCWVIRRTYDEQTESAESLLGGQKFSPRQP